MFDKAKAMRSAERYLSQGKIRDAINQYRQVVENDPRDVVTLNMLGDLYTKNAETKMAVTCFRSVADHYGRQGFAQKAIAIYNKISRLQPNSPEVSQKLAELYKVKGSLKEAKSHYSTLAEHYSSQGRRVEALEIWNEIAALDPNNLEVFLTVADAYLQEERLDEAKEAFCRAGERLLKHTHADAALDSFQKALAIDPKHEGSISGFVDAKFAVGLPAEAVGHIESLLNEEPHNRELLAMLVDATVRASDAPAAERALLRLVEMDPTHYMKCVELAELCRRSNDTDAAVRILNIASEHMLVGGHAATLQRILEQIDNEQPDRLDVVRMLARFGSWQKDDEYLRTTLVRLADIAGRENAVEDERYALSQLVMSMPQESRYADRLREINLDLGLPDDPVVESVFDKRFVRESSDGTSMESSAEQPIADEIVERANGNEFEAGEVNDDFAIVDVVAEETNGTSNGKKGAKRKTKRTKKTESKPESIDAEANQTTPPAADFPEELQREIDSIRFYIDNGYRELATKAIGELRSTYGDRAEIDELDKLVEKGESTENGNGPSNASISSIADNVIGTGAAVFDLADLRSELGLEDADTNGDSDFETHYQTAVAYQEMGLMEQAIKEFQEAAGLVSANDGTRRFFNCANLLGHCFMEMGKPNLAAKWHLRSLESFDISDEERQGVWYELGLAYDAEGDIASAAKYFEQVYAENIDFRDIGERMKHIAAMV